VKGNRVPAEDDEICSGVVQLDEKVAEVFR
jgi:hypothetical protein